MGFGSFFQAALEGFIEGGTEKFALRRLQQEYAQVLDEYGPDEHVLWWSKLAWHFFLAFRDHYANDDYLPLSAVTQSERNLRIEVPLPSGRSIVLNSYLDGEGDSLLFENKCRSNWDTSAFAKEIRWDMQYNIYLFQLHHESELPTKVWYQHVRRPLSWGYRGPKQRKSESPEEHAARIVEHLRENMDYYFYRLIARPRLEEVTRFAHAFLYPVLEHFLDWYEWIQDGEKGVNHYDWIMPYGLYHPALEGRGEAYRNWRLTGSYEGLRRRS